MCCAKILKETFNEAHTSFHYMNCEIILFLLLKVNDKSEGKINKVYVNMYVFQLCNQFHDLKIRKKKSHGN